MKTALTVVATLTLTACVGAEEAPAVGMANPASVYCMKQGGTLEIRDEAGGQVGYCHLPDGTIVEEWAYFRANNP